MKIILTGLLLIFPASTALAVIRPIFLPIGSQAIIMMQGASAADGGAYDPEPRELYESIAAVDYDRPGGGKGKVITLADKSFSFSCAERGTTQNNVMCNISIKASDHSTVSATEQVAEVNVLAGDAALLFQFFAGSGATEAFQWASKNHWIRIVSTPERFWFKFSKQ